MTRELLDADEAMLGRLLAYGASMIPRLLQQSFLPAILLRVLFERLYRYVSSGARLHRGVMM
jgi:hypothetical protein